VRCGVVRELGPAPFLLPSEIGESRVSGKLEFATDDVAVKKLLLDPNNYRFLDEPLFKRKAANKYHVLSVQEATLSRLERGPYQIDDLKASILTNGYIPMERVVITAYAHQKGNYIVVEGNRRVAALKSLLKENNEGSLELTAQQIENFSTIPVTILQGTGEDLRHLERIIMGIRHIAGPREWGAYQQALLVSELKDDEGLEFSAIGDMLGISPIEAARRYRAVRALQQMEKDELYAKRAQKSFYRLFHELVSSPGPRERFGWSSDDVEFTDSEKAREFYSLIAPTEGGTPKLSAFSDVRKLKQIVGNKKAEHILFDPDKSLADALRIVDDGQDRPSLSDIASEILRMVRNISVSDLGQVTTVELKDLNRAIAELNSLKVLLDKKSRH
jgi:ParB-like chromosome segregation protein Spo0J